MFEEGIVITVTKHLSVLCLLILYQVLLFTFLDIQSPHLFDIQIVSKMLSVYRKYPVLGKDIIWRWTTSIVSFSILLLDDWFPLIYVWLKAPCCFLFTVFSIVVLPISIVFIKKLVKTRIMLLSANIKYRWDMNFFPVYRARFTMCIISR